MEGFVYILRDSINGKLYIGSTNDITRRLYQHQHGHTSTTKRMQDIELVFSQKVLNIELARKIERRLKNLKRKDYIEKIIEDGYIKNLGV